MKAAKGLGMRGPAAAFQPVLCPQPHTVSYESATAHMSLQAPGTEVLVDGASGYSGQRGCRAAWVDAASLPYWGQAPGRKSAWRESARLYAHDWAA